MGHFHTDCENLDKYKIDEKYWEKNEESEKWIDIDEELEEDLKSEDSENEENQNSQTKYGQYLVKRPKFH